MPMLYQQALATLRRLKTGKSLEAGVTDNLGLLARELGDFKNAEKLLSNGYDSRVARSGRNIETLPRASNIWASCTSSGAISRRLRSRSRTD